MHEWRILPSHARIVNEELHRQVAEVFFSILLILFIMYITAGHFITLKCGII
jgi:hypothetical protein